jgi:hypothetical protein
VGRACLTFCKLISSVGLDSSQITPSAESLTHRAHRPFFDPFALPTISSRTGDVPRGFNGGHVQADDDGRHLVSSSARSNMYSWASPCSRIQGNWSETGSDAASPTASSSELPGASPLRQPRQSSLFLSQIYANILSRSRRFIDEVLRSVSATASCILPDFYLFFGSSHACARR